MFKDIEELKAAHGVAGFRPDWDRITVFPGLYGGQYFVIQRGGLPGFDVARLDDGGRLRHVLMAYDIREAKRAARWLGAINVRLLRLTDGLRSLDEVNECYALDHYGKLPAKSMAWIIAEDMGAGHWGADL